MEGEGAILELGLDHEEATRRELKAKLGCNDLKDRCFPGGIVDMEVTQKIRDQGSGVIRKEEGASSERERYMIHTCWWGYTEHGGWNVWGGGW
jgi:hypothetical protein